jgi:ATP-dependent Clp protease ATP-binding subunit ClpX
MRAERDEFPTPGQMIQHIDQHVHGQDEAKRVLASAVYKHYLSLAVQARQRLPRPPFGSKHVMLIGPTGCGKTHLVLTLAAYLGLPVTTVTATNLVESGYVGDHVDSIVHSLYLKAGRNMRRAQRGLIFVDEIDKIRRQGGAGDRDVAGEGVQTMLLPLLDGTTFSIPMKDEVVPFDASGVMVIAAGAFVGLPNVIRHRVSSATSFGFGCGSPNGPLLEDEALDQLDNQDLVRFGLIPEFIGRFSQIATLRALNKDDIVALLTQSDDSAIISQQRLFDEHGIQLCVTAGALEAVADRAIAAGTHARGAERIFIEALRSVDWRLPDLAAQGVDKVTIDDRVVLGHGLPRCDTGSHHDSRQSAAALRIEAQALLRPDEAHTPVASHRRSRQSLRTRRILRPKDDGQMWLPFECGQTS